MYVAKLYTMDPKRWTLKEMCWAEPEIFIWGSWLAPGREIGHYLASSKDLSNPQSLPSYPTSCLFYVSDIINSSVRNRLFNFEI